MSSDDQTQPGTILVIDGPRSALLEEVAASMAMPFKYEPIVPCAECKYFDCICLIRNEHKPDCIFLLARTTPFDVRCDQHKDPLCAECYACTCKKAA